jgi:type VI secretion system protein ImpB
VATATTSIQGERRAMSASIHDKLNRVRKPRVHITYEVETEGAQIVRELPFVVGVMGDFSGDPTQPLRPLADRKFIQIDRDNFNEVMARMTPGLNLKVDDKLSGQENKQMAVELKFNSIEDFEPARVVDQVPALKALLETRNKLRDLMSKVDRSDQLESLLEQVLKNEQELKALSGQLGVANPAGEG